MGSLYRSEEMKLCQIIVEKHTAYACVAQLGKQGYVQFKNLNAGKNIFQRPFAREVRRCDDLERSLRYLEDQICKKSIELDKQISVAEIDDDINIDVVPQPREIHTLETTLFHLEHDVRLLDENDSVLRQQLNDLIEYEQVLRKTDSFFEGGLDDEAQSEIEAAEAISDLQEIPLIDRRGDNGSTWFIAGVVPITKAPSFERVLWRACRRTVFVRSVEMTDWVIDSRKSKRDRKAAFIVFYKGERIKNMVDKICEGFKARQYPCPKTSKERQTAAIEATARIADLMTVFETTDEQTAILLMNVASKLRYWQRDVLIHKAIYNALNHFTVDTTGNFFITDCWIPISHVANVQAALENAVTSFGDTVRPVINLVETDEQPPTYYPLNKFTCVFQNIVDSYGIALYREVNPAPFTIITFPFLFAIMFGDCGHGFIMLLAAFCFIHFEQQIEAKRIKDEIFQAFFGGRYIILLMGAFSVYTGIIYNDAFGKSFNIFGSSWRNPYSQSNLDNWTIASNGTIMLQLPPRFAYLHEQGPYLLGVDPIWNLAENRLNFLNSMKMKSSVIIGIVQMTFGIFLSFCNYRYFKSKIEIFTMFVPQIVFISCIFVYLCAQIIVKWIVFWVLRSEMLGFVYPGSHCAPSLLIGLINMFMFKQRYAGFLNVTMDETGNRTIQEYEMCHLNQWYPEQANVEAVLVLLSVACIPIMLFGKPLSILLARRKTKQYSMRSQQNKENEDAIELMNIESGRMNDKSTTTAVSHEEDFTDIFVHQAIHTIEFVLGCISHTASYLRLWALSLAHAQLSEVLWHMILSNSFATSNPILGPLLTYFIFFIFATLTLAILVLMEGLSAFLHALRLHWVEFQSKFYIGQGYPFVPFSIRETIEKAQSRDWR